jgi:hypothetical protein
MSELEKNTGIAPEDSGLLLKVRIFEILCLEIWKVNEGFRGSA